MISYKMNVFVLTANINVQLTIIITRIIKTFLKMKEYVGIYIKTKKAQEQDGFGN